MADYGTYEITRQGAQPAELYKFFWGNGSVSGTSAGTEGSSDLSVVVDDLVPSCSDTFGSTAPTATLVEDWTGGNDTDISGRTLSGGTGVWTTMLLSTSRIDIVSGVARMPAVDNIFPEYHIPSSGLGADQSVSATGKFTSEPGLAEHVGFGVMARVDPAGDDKGYVMFCDRTLAGTVYVQEIYFQLWNNPDYTAIGNTYVPDAFPLNEEHTIRMDVVGNKLYGYLDGTLVVYAEDTDSTHATGDPGFLEFRVDPLIAGVEVTHWEAANAVAPVASVETVVWNIDEFTGADDPSIDLRIPDGSGVGCLGHGTWRKTEDRAVNVGIVTEEAVYKAATPIPTPGWIHHVVDGIPNLPTDITVEILFQIHGFPVENAWVSCLARHSSTEESGYESTLLFTNASIVAQLWLFVAGTYTLMEIKEYARVLPLNEDQKIRLCMNGSLLRFFLNDELILATVDTTNTYPDTGSPGMCMMDDTGGGLVTVKRWRATAPITGNPCGTDTTGSPGSGIVGDALLTLNYTSADVPITYEGEVYEPFIAHRTPFRLGTGERSAAEIDLSIPMDHPVATLVQTGLPRAPIGVIVYRLDRQDTTDGAAAIPLQGQVTKHRIEGRWCILTLGNVGTLLTRKLPRMLTQRSCPHVLYGPFCQKSAAAFTVTGLTVNAIQGRVINIVGATTVGDPTYFEQGVLVTATGLREFIELQSGDSLTLKQVVPGLEEGDTVTLIAGCDHLASTCDTRFTNILHFGGEIGIQSNPATGAGLVSAVTTPGEA